MSSQAYHNVNVFLLFHNTLEELRFEMVADPQVYFTPWVIFVRNNNNNSQHTCSAVNTNQAHNKMQSGCSQRRLAGTITDSRACSLSGGALYPVRWALIVNKAMNMNTDDVWCQCCCGKWMTKQLPLKTRLHAVMETINNNYTFALWRML